MKKYNTDDPAEIAQAAKIKLLRGLEESSTRIGLKIDESKGLLENFNNAEYELYKNVLDANKIINDTLSDKDKTFFGIA